MKKLEGIIFDMDGTLIDSEPLWQEAEIEIFGCYGLIINQSDCIKTQGLQPYDAVKFWYHKMIKPKKNISQVTDELCNRVIELFIEKGALNPGVTEILDFFASCGYPIAVASASPVRFIEAMTHKFKLANYFKFLYSGDFERYGKPHPGIYISAAKKLKANPEYCLAFEDSFNGMLAAKAARMKLAAYISPLAIQSTKFDFADMKLESFHNFGRVELEYIESLI